MTPAPANLQDTVRVAAAQYPIDRPAHFDDWARKISRWVEDGAATGAELLVFPEYAGIELASTFGTAVEQDLQAQITAVSGVVAAVDDHHRALAAAHGVHILAGSLPVLVDGSERPVNRARLFTPSGKMGYQDKRVMTPWERDIWGIQGDPRARVFDTALGRIGIAICYDVEFPLIVRAMVAAGADIILAPSATETRAGAMRVRVGAMARAMENQVAVVTSPTVGEAPWSPALDVNYGAAGMYVPADIGLPPTGVIVEGGMNEPGWVTGAIERQPLRAVRDTGGVRGHADWGLQSGAREAALASNVEIIALG